ncbi:MAG TPA: PepSY domain-containing protein [Gammaproteobacteria bacterium]
MRRFVIFVHRYLGIPMSIVFVVWFVSGIVMMYAGGMPRLTSAERLARVPALDLSRITVSPAEAAAAAGLSGSPGRTSVGSILGRPAYRFEPFPGAQVTVFADSAEILGLVGPEQALSAAAAFLGEPEQSLRFVQTLTSADQWTLTQGRNLPLHQFRVDDDQETTVYVSETSGQVALTTTRRTRMLAWLGTIPHWFYFSALRSNQPLWYRTVVWVSALGCLMAILGLALAVLQFKRSRPFSLKASIRYRGWARWHYISGAVFGVFALTWVFSGMLSMEPFRWTRVEEALFPGDVLAGSPVDLGNYPELDASRWQHVAGAGALKELEYLRIMGDPYFLVRVANDAKNTDLPRERLHQPYGVALNSGRGEFLVDARTLDVREAPFPTELLIAKLQGGLGAQIERYDLLHDYDGYYYSQSGQAALPILRVKFDDPLATWMYIDPAMATIVAQVHRYSRLERWLFNGLHSLDFGFWYDKRPLWDVGMILLSIGALATSAIGMFLGFRRLAAFSRRRELRNGSA